MFKKSFLILLCVCMLLCSAPASILAAETTTTETAETIAPIMPDDEVSTDEILIYSCSCIVMDADTGQILYGKNIHDRHFPASITKILSALLLIENSELDDMITYTNDVWEGLNYYNDMNIGMLDGEELSVEASLHAMLLSSANEICNGVASHVSGSIEAFADLMNERAAFLGCQNTHFTNPSGLHNEDHYTSAYDMALISADAIKNETFARITGSYEYTVDSTNKRPEGFVLGHKHKMLMYTNYHYNACIGGKTGYTEEAKNTLVTYAKKNDRLLVCVAMENNNGHIYPDTITALDYCFDHYDALSETAPYAELTKEAFANRTDEPIEETIAETGEHLILKEQDQTKVSSVNQSVQKITQKLLNHFPLLLGTVFITILVLILFIFWVKRLCHRHYHRHQYKKLRNKRLNNR